MRPFYKHKNKINLLNKLSPSQRGEQSEQLACDYLIKQGLQLVKKNYLCQYGELDLIMKDKNALVIIEVRFRKSNKYGSAEESVTPKKQSRIIAATQHYLLHHSYNGDIRFDVIAIRQGNFINWIKNAFYS